MWGFKHACEALADRVYIQTEAWECCELCEVYLAECMVKNTVGKILPGKYVCDINSRLENVSNGRREYNKIEEWKCCF